MDQSKESGQINIDSEQNTRRLADKNNNIYEYLLSPYFTANLP